MKKIFLLLIIILNYLGFNAQNPHTLEEASFGQNFCYLGQANRPPIPSGVTCNCKWEWIQYHSNVFPCYPFNGMQLVYEEHFNDVNNQVRPPYSSAPYQSFDEQVIYRDWRLGYGYNGANTGDPSKTNETSWDADPANINVQNGNLQLQTVKLPAPFKYAFYSDPTTFFNTQYTGGTIMTEDKWGYGEFEIRCKMSADPEGINHAFWLLGGSLDGCTQEEIDVFETFDDIRNQNSIYDIQPSIEQKNRRIKTTIWSSPCDDDGARCERYLHSKLAPGQHLSDWHTYKLAWTPYETTLFIDGNFVYKMFSFGLGLFQTNPIQDGTGCNFMTTTADAVDLAASFFPSWWPPALIPTYHVKRMKTYPRAEKSTLHLLVQDAIRVNNGQHLNLPQQMEVDYVKVWQFGDCQNDIIKTGTFSVGCNKDAPYLNYHMGHNITYQTNFVLSAANICDPVDENKNYQNERLIACASNDIIFLPGTTFEYGTKFETRIQPCTPITNSSGIAPPIGLFRTNNSGSNPSYPGLRDTVINGQMALYEPDHVIEGYSNNDILAYSEFMINPNPASNEITLQSSFNSGTYEVFNSMGENVGKGDIHDFKQTIDISVLKDGIYTVKISIGKITKQARFIKTSK